jgi:hypothetical protein
VATLARFFAEDWAADIWLKKHADIAIRKVRVENCDFMDNNMI